MSGSIEFTCEGCGKVLIVGPEMAGKKGRCRSCNHMNAIPDAEPEPEPVASGFMPGRRPPPPPEPVQSPAMAPASLAIPVSEAPAQRVVLIAVDMPFDSMCWLIFKWTCAALPTMVAMGMV